MEPLGGNDPAGGSTSLEYIVPLHFCPPLSVFIEKWWAQLPAPAASAAMPLRCDVLSSFGNLKSK